MEFKRNSRSTPGHKSIRLSPYALFALAALLTLAYCRRATAGPEFPLPATLPAGVRVQLDYGGRDLTSVDLPLQIPPGANLPPAGNSTREERKAAHGNEPVLLREGENLCVFSGADFYFQKERGLRFGACLPVSGKEEEELRKALAVARENPAGPYPDFQGVRLRFRAIGAGELLKEPGISALIDGHPLQAAFRLRDSLKNILYFRSSFPGEDEKSQGPILARVFPLVYFHLLVKEKSAALLYEIPGSSRFFMLEIRSPAIAAKVLAGISRLKRADALARKSATPGPARISEIRFSFADSESLLELSGDPSRDLIDRLEIENEKGYTREFSVWIPAGGTVLLGKKEFPFRSGIELLRRSDGRVFRYDRNEAKDRGASHLRSLVAEFSDDADLLPATYCLNGPPCGSIGFHPVFAENEARKRSREENEAYCGPRDLVLSEWNPFGVRLDAPDGSPGRLHTGGKFLELKAQRDCRLGELLVFAGPALLDPGFGEIRSGELLLFVASAAFFYPDRSRIASGLRRVSPRSEIFLHEPRTGKSVALRKPASAGVLYLPGQARYDARENRTGGGPFRRVHSLVRAGPSGREVHHGHDSRGLRPDIARTHAMSPGFSQAADVVPASVRLSELFPSGSWNLEGRSVPGDEFLEFLVAGDPAANASPGSLLLEITRASDGKRFTLLTPRPGPGTRRFALFKSDPVCFAPRPEFVRVSGLYLPNGAARYLLRDGMGETLDEVFLDEVLYSYLDRRDRRLSYGRLAGRDFFRPEEGRQAFSHDCEKVGATPGEPAAPHPFLRLVKSDDQGLHLIFHTPGPEERLRLRSFGGGTASSVDIALTATDGESLVFPYPNIAPGLRFLLSVSLSGDSPGRHANAPDEIFFREEFRGAPLLLFDAVAPVPISGEYEWIRLCSPGGFAPEEEKQGLYLFDSAYSDRIVPWARRFGSVPAPFTPQTELKLSPGKCALLVDPDFQGPPPPGGDALWTTETGKALGNGLSRGEGLLLRRLEGNGELSVLAAFGAPDSARPFSLDPPTGSYVRRVRGTVRDLPENYEIIAP